MNPYISAPKNLLYFSLLPPVIWIEYFALLTEKAARYGQLKVFLFSDSYWQ